MKLVKYGKKEWKKERERKRIVVSGSSLSNKKILILMKSGKKILGFSFSFIWLIDIEILRTISKCNVRIIKQTNKHSLHFFFKSHFNIKVNYSLAVIIIISFNENYYYKKKKVNSKKRENKKINRCHDPLKFWNR